MAYSILPSWITDLWSKTTIPPTPLKTVYVSFHRYLRAPAGHPYPVPPTSPQFNLPAFRHRRPLALSWTCCSQCSAVRPVPNLDAMALSRPQLLPQ